MARRQPPPHDATTLIRPAVPADAALLTTVGAESFADAYAGQLPPAELAAIVAGLFSLERQQAELADPATFFLILEVEGQAAGYAALHAAPMGQP